MQPKGRFRLRRVNHLLLLLDPLTDERHLVLWAASSRVGFFRSVPKASEETSTTSSSIAGDYVAAASSNDAELGLDVLHPHITAFFVSASVPDVMK
ncbi:MAG: hypothetical protein SGPRY_013032 [Prymnesium sp.]